MFCCNRPLEYGKTISDIKYWRQNTNVSLYLFSTSLGKKNKIQIQFNHLLGGGQAKCFSWSLTHFSLLLSRLAPSPSLLPLAMGSDLLSTAFSLESCRFPGLGVSSFFARLDADDAVASSVVLRQFSHIWMSIWTVLFRVTYISEILARSSWFRCLTVVVVAGLTESVAGIVTA